jgi:hypothetical protein
VDAREGHPEREGDVVGEDQRRRAGAALAAVDGDEVDAALAVDHALGQLGPEALLADGGLDADRQAGRVGQSLDEVQQPIDALEGRVPRRADAVAPLGDAPDGGDLGRDLGARQDASQARLGALAELDLDRAHGVPLAGVGEARQVETSGPAVGLPGVDPVSAACPLAATTGQTTRRSRFPIGLRR